MLMCALESHLKVTSVISLCDPKDYSSPGSSCPWDSLGKNTGAGCHVPLQGIFPTQELNLGVPYHGQMLYPLSHQVLPVVPKNIKER